MGILDAGHAPVGQSPLRTHQEHVKTPPTPMNTGRKRAQIGLAQVPASARPIGPIPTENTKASELRGRRRLQLDARHRQPRPRRRRRVVAARPEPERRDARERVVISIALAQGGLRFRHLGLVAALGPLKSARVHLCAPVSKLDARLFACQNPWSRCIDVRMPMPDASWGPKGAQGARRRLENRAARHRGSTCPRLVADASGLVWGGY